MSLGKFHHAGDTLRKEPVISMDDFAIFTLGGDLSESKISILITTNEIRVVMNADPLIFQGIPFSNFESSIGTAVIDDDVFPILIGLSQHTFYALTEIVFTVIDWSENTDEWFIVRGHRHYRLVIATTWVASVYTEPSR
jgi:hypothetical protein